MKKIRFYPEGIRRLIRRENARIRRASRQRTRGYDDLFTEPDYYEREEAMARLHLDMLKGVLAECLHKQVADLTPADWEITAAEPPIKRTPCRFNLGGLGMPADTDSATTIFMCHSEVQAKG